MNQLDDAPIILANPTAGFRYIVLRWCSLLLRVVRTLHSHRNASLRKWLVEEHMLGEMGMGHPAVDGTLSENFTMC